MFIVRNKKTGYVYGEFTMSFAACAFLNDLKQMGRNVELVQG